MEVKENTIVPAHHRKIWQRLVFTGLSVLIAAAGFFVVTPIAQADPPPPNPTDGQITTAQQAKTALATQVGQLSAQVALLQTQLDKAQSDAQVAEQQVAFALQQLDDSQQAAQTAANNLTAANNQVMAAHAKFSEFVGTTYMSTPVNGTFAALLTAPDPESLLRYNDYASFAGNHQLDAIAQLDRATVAQSNADATARGAVVQQQKAKDAALTVEQNAKSVLAASETLQQQTSASLADQQTALQTAQANLATLNNQRQQYDAYVAEQARLAAERAAAAEAAAAAARAARQNSHPSPGNGGGVPTAPTDNGRWTAAAGQTAVNRAMAYLGWPYSWAAGNANGPTYGVSVDYASRNDSHILGFDCSGLTLYAWAPYLRLAHLAAMQYGQAGSVHPNTASLMPGDLVFWSGNGTVSGIGHEAMYIGDGKVLQAPQSGDIIRITPIGQVESGYFGTTRPLT